MVLWEYLGSMEVLLLLFVCSTFCRGRPIPSRCIPAFPCFPPNVRHDMEQETKYSRIPVYSGEIDRISGVVLSKDLLDFVQVRKGRGIEGA